MADVRSYLKGAGVEKKRRRLFFLVTGGIGAVFFLCILMFWFVARSGLFFVTHLEIVGNERIRTEDVQTFLLGQVTRGSYIKSVLTSRNILAWPKEFSEDMLRLLPEAESVVVEKDYQSRSLVVRVTEREEEGIWCAALRQAQDKQGETRCFWFDGAGVAFKRAVAAEGNLITAVGDYTGRAVGVGVQVLEEEALKNLLPVFQVLRDIELSVSEIRVEDIELHEVKVVTHDGPVLYFSIGFPPGGAHAALERIRQEEDIRELEYIDFRVENRVYYK